jgi:hypothetical protein
MPVLAWGEDAATTEAEAAALAAVERFMEVFNSRDWQAWSRLLHYPHVRLAAGRVDIWQTPEEYAADWELASFAKQTGWDHSRYDRRDVIQASPDKVHVAVAFTRYRKDGSRIASYQALYVVTRQGEGWGIQARSSFAP